MIIILPSQISVNDRALKKAPARIKVKKSPIIILARKNSDPQIHIFNSKISAKITAYIFFIEDNTITANPKKQKANRPFLYPI